MELYQLEAVERSLRKHLQDWLSDPYYRHLPHRQWGMYLTAILVADARCSKFRISSDATARSGVIIAVEEIVETMEQIGQGDTMSYWPDSLSQTLARPGLYLYEARGC